MTFIKGAGHYLPKKVLTNLDLSKIVDTNDEWIRERTGIQERRIAAPDQSTSDLAYNASIQALANAETRAEDVQAIIVATTTPDYIFPSVACLLQDKLGAKNAFCFDLTAACSGFIYAMTVAHGLLNAGQVDNVLIVGAETLSRVTDYKDRQTCILFGDGAGAVLLSRRSEKSKIPFSSVLSADGSLKDLLYLKSERARDPFEKPVAVEPSYIVMQGREVFKNAVREMTRTSLACLEKAGLTMEQVDRFVAHQANERILDMVGSKLGLHTDRIISTIAMTGNTSAASIPIALAQAIESKKIVRGNMVLATAFGGGLTAGALVFEY